MSNEILAYNKNLSGEEKEICAVLYEEVNRRLLYRSGAKMTSNPVSTNRSSTEDIL